MLGGWLDLLCTYREVVDDFENGLNLPVVRSRVDESVDQSVEQNLRLSYLGTDY